MSQSLMGQEHGHAYRAQCSIILLKHVPASGGVVLLGTMAMINCCSITARPRRYTSPVPCRIDSKHGLEAPHPVRAQNAPFEASGRPNCVFRALQGLMMKARWRQIVVAGGLSVTFVKGWRR